MAGIGTWLYRLFGGKEDLDPGRWSPRSRDRSSGPRSFADDNNDFAIAMYGQLRRAPGNVFFSPFSIRTALCMSQAGARGETAEQMRAALSISSSDESAYAAFAEAIRRLNAVGGRAYEMAVANSLWGQEGAPLEAGYLDLIARTFDGDMKALDFRRGAEAARATINQWVEDKTRRKIPDLIPPGGVERSHTPRPGQRGLLQGRLGSEVPAGRDARWAFSRENSREGAGAADAPGRARPISARGGLPGGRTGLLRRRRVDARAPSGPERRSRSPRGGAPGAPARSPRGEDGRARGRGLPAEVQYDLGNGESRGAAERSRHITRLHALRCRLLRDQRSRAGTRGFALRLRRLSQGLRGGDRRGD